MEQLIGLIAFLSFQNDPFKDPIFLFFVPVSDQSLCPYTHLQTGKNPESTHPINTCFLAHIREFLYFNHIQICLTKALSGEREEVRGRNSVKANLVSSSKKKKTVTANASFLHIDHTALSFLGVFHSVITDSRLSNRSTLLFFFSCSL